MTERERTVIRLVGLVVHAAGLAWIFYALAVGGIAVLPGLVAFVVGGAWGWGMVAMAAREDTQRRLEATAAVERERAYRDRAGFTAKFDDEPELGPPPRTIGGE